LELANQKSGKFYFGQKISAYLLAATFLPLEIKKGNFKKFKFATGNHKY